MRKFLILAPISLAILTVNCATEQAYISGEKCDAPIWNDGDSREKEKEKWGQVLKKRRSGVRS